MDDLEVMKSEVSLYFQKRFREEWTGRPKIGGIFEVQIGRESAVGLEREFFEAEIWEAIKYCDGNKSPGLDGFNLIFFKKCWKILKEDIMVFFKEFQDNGKLLKEINSSFIVLIPKSENPDGLCDFQPISLVGSVYKILSKVLASRVKKILPSLIGDI